MANNQWCEPLMLKHERDYILMLLREKYEATTYPPDKRYVETIIERLEYCID